MYKMRDIVGDQFLTKSTLQNKKGLLHTQILNSQIQIGSVHDDKKRVLLTHWSHFHTNLSEITIILKEF